MLGPGEASIIHDWIAQSQLEFAALLDCCRLACQEWNRFYHDLVVRRVSVQRLIVAGHWSN